jgi:hypothetical protein
MGPAGIGAALYPPHSSDRMRFDVYIIYCIHRHLLSSKRRVYVFISIQTYVGAQTNCLYLNSHHSTISISRSVSLYSTVYSEINVLFSLFLYVFLSSLYTLHMYKERYVFYTFLSPPPHPKPREQSGGGGGQNTCSLLHYCIYSWCCVCIV